MRPIIVFFILLASTTKALANDSLQVFHDRNGYITCISNGEYRATFLKSELQSISFETQESAYDVKTRTLTVRCYGETSAAYNELKFVLRDDAPLIEWNNTTSRLDTSSQLSMVKGENLIQTTLIAGINYSTTFLDGLLQIIEIELLSRQIINIAVRKLGGNQTGYFYTISAKPQNGSGGLLLEYAMNGKTPLSLLMISDKTKQSAFLYSKWKWQKFQWLSIKQYSNDPLKDSSDVYRLEYDKSGKVKGKINSILKVGNCKR